MKLNYFLNDTLEGSRDSVLAILYSGIDLIPFAKSMLPRAYADLGHQERAEFVADSLAGFEELSDLMTLESGILSLADNNLYSLSEDANIRTLIDGYVQDSSIAGYWQAKAVSHLIYGHSMNYRYLEIGEEEGQRLSKPNRSNREQVLRRSLSPERSVWSVFPNPADDSFSIEREKLKIVQPTTLTIIDATGKQVVLKTLPEDDRVYIPVMHLDSGIYFVILTDSVGFRSTTKMIVQHK